MVKSKRRIDKLDNLLLFSASTIGLLFTIIQNFLGNLALVFFLPLIFVGLINPVLVGYGFGALEDSMEDRIRGWGYFFFGIGVYLVFTSLAILRPTFQNFGRSVIAILISLALFIIIYIMGEKMVKIISNSYDYQIESVYSKYFSPHFYQLVLTYQDFFSLILDTCF